MPIAALPANTVRVIGSSQVLTDPCSVVKELIDNALDAQASSIFVEISSNTLDVIQVKDNGYGIGPEDRSMVCRRACTSKIRNLEDLKTIGGRSLGFRGEALASAAELSGGLVVTTRVDGESVAVSLKISRIGDIEREEKASHPVGTTVRVIDFLKHLPVRRQTTLRLCTKTLAKVKHTLQAYAIARPSIRLSLKILKAKNDKGNWIYAPRAGAGVPDAATKVVDKATAGQCQWISWSSPEASTVVVDSMTETDSVSIDTTRESSYLVEAFIPKPNAEASAISHAGQYISIDSRPVSCTRGLLKQLMTIYKRYIRAACSKDAEKIADPFLCMNIVCRLGSYDANIEPAKDDVLFTDPGQLLATLETFFKSVYGELPVTNGKEASGSKLHSLFKSRKSGFDLLLARKPQSPDLPTSSAIDVPVIETGDHGSYKHCDQNRSSMGADENIAQDNDLTPAYIAPSHREEIELISKHVLEPRGSPRGRSPDAQTYPSTERSTWHFSMYGGEEEDSEELDGLQPQSVHEAVDEEEDSRDIQVSNPWTIAKMNTFVRPVRRAEPADNDEDISGNGQLMTPARGIGGYGSGTISRIDLVRREDEHADMELMTPQRSQRFPTPSTEGVSSCPAWQFPSKAWGKARSERESISRKEQGHERIQAGALDDWVQKSSHVSGIWTPDRSLPRRPAEGEETGFISARVLPHTDGKDLGPGSGSQQGTLLSQIPELPPKRRQSPRKQHQSGPVHKPFISPVRDPHKVWFEMGPSSQTKAHLQARSKNAKAASSATAPIQFASEADDVVEELSPVNSTIPLADSTEVDLEQLMDYEHRKRAANQAYRTSLRKPAHSPTINASGPRVDESRLSSVNSPHRNRYEAAKAALSTSKDATDNAVPPIFAEGDPRAYLMRVQQREDVAGREAVSGASGSKIRRARTTMLPLETVAADRRVQDLVLNLSTDVPSIKKREGEVMGIDDFVRCGEIGCGLLNVVEDDVRGWEQRLSIIFQKAFKESETGNMASLAFDIWPVLQEHGVAHA